MSPIGYWIDTYTQEQTAGALLWEYRGEIVQPPDSIKQLPAGKALVVVGYHKELQEEGAFLVFEDEGLIEFICSREVSNKTFLLLDTHVAHNLAQYHPA